MKVNLSILASTACALMLAMPLAAASQPATSTMRTAWPAETLSGTMAMVDSGQKVVVVQDSSGVPFDMIVTPNTRIQSGDRTITFNDLTGDMTKTVSVKYIPERRGDVATSIRING